VRYIDQDRVECELPQNWKDMVRDATDHVGKMVTEAREKAFAEGRAGNEIEEVVAKARSSAIKARASLWQEAGKALRKVSARKCWYCEARQDRSDMPVDHFRPKNRVAECPEHPGYHWLAFDWRNYRYACTYCNSHRRDVDHGTAGGHKGHKEATMGGGFAHITLVDALCKDADVLDGIASLTSAMKRLLAFNLNFVELGAVSPDCPCLCLLDDNSAVWANVMHYCER